MYNVSVKSESEMPMSVYIFQKYNQNNNTSPLVLVWLCRNIEKNHIINFTWNPDKYSAYCCKNGTLFNSPVYSDILMVDAFPSKEGKNSFTLSLNGQTGLYKLMQNADSNEKNYIYITCDGTIPNNKATIGFCMDDIPVCSSLTATNITFSFSTKTEYYINCGNYEKGMTVPDSVIENSLKFIPNNLETVHFLLTAANKIIETPL